ncbi:hypothetical protein [Amycolatopsis sp. NPDC051102]|uniref:hypothetical protein n=1 Tax=Amycolatopsis sp. NPDC051102 TaxID=3155163 RepID=UPI00341850EA
MEHVTEGWSLEAAVLVEVASTALGLRLLCVVCTTPGVVDAIAAEIDETAAPRLLTVTAQAAAHVVVQPQVGDALTSLRMRHGGLLVAAVRVVPSIEPPAPLLRALGQAATSTATSTATLLMLRDAVPFRTNILADVAADLAETIVGRQRPVFHAPYVRWRLVDHAALGSVLPRDTGGHVRALLGLPATDAPAKAVCLGAH